MAVTYLRVPGYSAEEVRAWYDAGLPLPMPPRSPSPTTAIGRTSPSWLLEQSIKARRADLEWQLARLDEPQDPSAPVVLTVLLALILLAAVARIVWA